MTTDLHESLAQAASTGRAHFETAEVDPVIDAAARRVRSHRATVNAVSAVGALALVSGVMWGVDVFSANSAVGVDPAGSVTPTSGIDTADGAEPWTINDLLSLARPRAKGDQDAYSTTGLVCNHDAATDDPRVGNLDDPTVSHAMTVEDCKPVWFKASAAYLTPVTAYVSSGTADGAAQLTYSYKLRNDTSWALALDTDSVFMWFETDPGADSGSISAYSNALVGETMWAGAGTVLALLDSSSESQVIEPGDSWSGSITLRGDATDDQLYKILTGSDSYRITLWGRVHEDSPSGQRSVLIQLGDAFEAQPTGDITSPN